MARVESIHRACVTSSSWSRNLQLVRQAAPPGSALLRSVAHGDGPSLVAKLPARSRRAGGRQDGRVDRADVRDRQAPTGPRSLAVYSTPLFVLHSLSASDITASARHQQRLEQSLNALRGRSTQKYFGGLTSPLSLVLLPSSLPFLSTFVSLFSCPPLRSSSP